MNKIISMYSVALTVLFAYMLYGCEHVKDKTPQTQFIHDGWVFYADSSPDKRYLAEVPGTIHTDLLRNKLIDDPFYGNNEIAMKALEPIQWVYETSFDLNENHSHLSNKTLKFAGLDTYSEIILNDQSLGLTDNMFRSWTFDVGDILRQKNNILKIKFTPPRHYNKSTIEDLLYILPADNEADSVKISPYTRKAPYHFGWDWGPRMITSGIWKSISLIQHGPTSLEGAYVQTISLDAQTAQLEYDLQIKSEDFVEDVKVEIADTFYLIKLKPGNHPYRIPFEISDPKLWWPNGSGDVHLYESDLVLSANGLAFAHHTISYGVRTVELVNEPDSIGTSFYFKVNGKPLFMQGANYIPQDVFIPRVSHDQYRTLLLSAQDAGMNMLRVWGGGIYEQDIFYDLCDSLGLLVWQDFMFAGTMYPGDDIFINNVRQEVEEQVERLKGHPSVALFCGNNELEVAWFNWGWQEKYNYSTVDSTEIWNNYLELFHGLIPNIIDSIGNGIAYTPTSPLSNWGTPENFNHSSMHYWGVWHGRENFEDYETNVGRFMVEYGMQSYPELSTISTFAPEDQLSLTSAIMQNRQKSYIGNDEILKHIEQHYESPTDFADFVSLSQQSQAKALAMAIRAHKSSDGHCMGTLLWQLNDCWPGPSWSIIDYYGNEKVAYDSVGALFGVWGE